jgi:hypothetical protein
VVRVHVHVDDPRPLLSHRFDNRKSCTSSYYGNQAERPHGALLAVGKHVFLVSDRINPAIHPALMADAAQAVKNSTNDAAAPSIPDTFGFVDSTSQYSSGA